MNASPGAMNATGLGTNRAPWPPMLHDDIWRRLADEYDTLCPECMFARARARGIKLTFADLLPCSFNLLERERGRSWFNLFLGVEKQKPDLGPWQAELKLVAKIKKRLAAAAAKAPHD
jgi:hypothetical protein